MPPMPINEARRNRVVARQMELAADILAELAAAVDAGHPADRSLARLYRQHREWGSRDRRFFAALVFAFFRWRGWLPPLQMETPDAWRKLGALAWLLDGGARHPTLDAMLLEAGLEADTTPCAADLSLEKKAQALTAWVQGMCAPPVPSDLAPAWMPDELQQGAAADREQAARIWLAWLQARPPTWLRLRPGRENKTLAAFKAAGINAKRHSALASAFSVEPGVNLEALPESVRAGFVIHDLRAQAVGFAAAPLPGERWWDVCAGSGGKALHLMDIANNRLSLLATDIRQGVVEQFSRRMRRAGIAGVTACVADGRLPPDGQFDGIFVDAPCTGSGTWHRNPDGRWRTSKADMDEAVILQHALLSNAALHLKRGGRLLYATCSVFRRENSGQLEAFLSAHPSFEPDTWKNPLTGETVAGVAYFEPDAEGGNAMYVFRLRKIGD